MATSLYKFRLGVQQHITLRCDRVGPILRCRARAVLGSLQWSAEIDASERQIEQFLADIARVLSSLSGVAELKPSNVGAFSLRVSVDPRGQIKTEYEATGWNGGFKTNWVVEGSYLCEHQSYLKRLERGQPAAG
jgi:hypothetical protein